jgi:hypothetical protein
MSAFEVVGDLLGEEGLDGEEVADILGAVKAARGRGRMLRLPAKPSWRSGQLAPGVMTPQEGLVPLPMTAQAGSPVGTFTATLPSITFLGRLQKPYRAERLLVSSVRTGATSTGRLLGQIFVGTDLQQAQINGFDLELIGPATAFGTRLTLLQAPPGVEINVAVTLSSGLTAPDTIFASMLFLGRVVH